MTDRHEAFVVDGPLRVEVKLAAGDVRFVEADGASADITVSGRRVDEFRIERVGEAIRLEAPRGRRSHLETYDVRAAVPAGTDLDVAVASAGVQSEVALGEVEIRTASGDVRLGDVTGSSSIASASGDVTVRAVAGKLRVATASGDIRIGRTELSGDLTTASGDVAVEQCSGDLRAKSASGDLILQNCACRDVACKTMAGDVRVGLAAGRTVELDVHTLAGDIRNRFEGVAGGGGDPTRLQVKTVSGDVILSPA